MQDWLDRLSIEHPVMQAGMGAGITTYELVSSVITEGGIGTVGYLVSPELYEQEIQRIKRTFYGRRTYAANLLMHFDNKEHIAVCIKHKVPIVTMFWGINADAIRALKEAGCFIMYQAGSMKESEDAVAAGVDALIYQGVEAGGHVRSTRPLADELPKIKERFKYLPVFAAGGIWNKETAANAKSLGADGVSCGTRFVMTSESGAHTLYKNKLVEAQSTLLTSLFGLGWDAPCRLVPNQSTDRWCDKDGNFPTWLQSFNRFGEILLPFLPDKVKNSVIHLQTPNRPIFTPDLLSADIIRNAEKLVEATPILAGDCVKDIKELSPASVAFRDIAQGY